MKPVPPGHVYVEMSATLRNNITGSFCGFTVEHKGLIRIEPDLFDSNALVAMRARQNAELRVVKKFLQSEHRNSVVSDDWDLKVLRFKHSLNYPEETSV